MILFDLQTPATTRAMLSSPGFQTAAVFVLFGTPFFLLVYLFMVQCRSDGSRDVEI